MLKGEHLIMNSVTKCAIVTGGSGGIGGAVTKRLAKDGFAVIVNYVGKAAPAQAVLEEINAAGGQGMVVQADVVNAGDVERLFKESMEAFGEPEVVVHCAGIMPLFQISGGDVATFDKVIATNLRGAFLVLAQAAQHVTDGGRIVAFSSSALAKSFPGYGAYIASKAGVEGLVHVLANELRGRNISVNAVAPGPVGTDLFLQGKNAEQIDSFKRMSPLERLGMPEDIANLVSFLAGADGGWINSQILRANGGFA
jgi:3-oxoacyl-[acyl-carrier protein] reductase